MLHLFEKKYQSLVLVLGIFFLTAIMPFFLNVANAQSETRSLKLYFVHTGERDEIVFKRDGKFDQAGLKKLNYFLRDWRRNEPTNMDPRLFDLVWTVYRQTGSREPITVVSAYRSPATNNMLRSRSKNSGVAKASQHTLGHAMDFYFPDVKLAKLRAIGLRQQVGGVGYYPKSGSPFIHMDTGSVRHWPRMNRQELLAVFPDGRTLHVPSDGKALPGYQQAVADLKARKSVPVVIATAENKKRGGGLFGLLGKKKETSARPFGSSPVPSSSIPVAPVPVPAQAPDFEPEQNVIIALPKDGAPIPSWSPFHNQANEIEDATVMTAYANVPLPSHKPDLFDGLMEIDASAKKLVSSESLENLIDQDGTPVKNVQNLSSTTVLVASTGFSQHRPREILKAAPSLNYANDTELYESKIIEASDQISKLIAEGYNDEKSNKKNNKLYNKSVSGAPSDDNLVELIDSAEAVIPVPLDDDINTGRSDEYYYGGQFTQAANFPQKKSQPNSFSNSRHIRQELSANEELRSIPSTVFVSQLEKIKETKKTKEQYSALSGKAVDFHPVLQVY